MQAVKIGSIGLTCASWSWLEGSTRNLGYIERIYPVRSRDYTWFQLHFLHHVALWLIAIEVFFLLFDSGDAGVFEKERHFA